MPEDRPGCGREQSSSPAAAPCPALGPGERVDALGRDGLRIIQNPGVFRFTTDAYLLAAFARPRADESVLELGSGSGVVLMLLAARTGAARLVGLEIQPILAEMGARNLALNRLDGKAEIIEGDLRRPQVLSPARFGLVAANPPYIPAKTGVESPSGPLAQAKHELSCTLREVAEAAARYAEPRGRFVMVHRPARLPEILAELARVRLEPKLLVLVHPDPGKEAGAVLVEGRAGARPGLTVAPPLFVRDGAGGFTPQMEEIFAGRWPLGR